jgi:ABC-type transporter lipoprotein component MlaA
MALPMPTLQSKDFKRILVLLAAAAQVGHAAVTYGPPINDPFEPVNRGIGYMNHGIMIGVIDPTAFVYRLIIPKPARKCVNNAGYNLAYPGRLVNNLLQAQWSGAGVETGRFLVNSTAGVAGLFDPATRWGIGSSEEDTGLTFRKWGWESQAYLMLPLFGPSSERDALGRIGDSLMNPATYLFPASPIFTYNRLTDDIIPYKQLTSTTYDPYVLSRDLWAFSRLEEDEPPPGAASDGDSALDTLKAARVAPQDTNFHRRAKHRKVLLPTTGEKLPYSLWLQKKPAPVLYLLPGLAGHREGSMVVALAELAFNAGYTVCTISSPMNWEFIRLASTAQVPGYPPIDSRDVFSAIDAIHQDLLGRYGARITGRVLMGMSLGAFHTLVIADAEQGGKDPRIHFDLYVALNPPVDLLYGMKQLDSFLQAPLKWPAAERQDRMEEALVKGASLAVAQGDEKKPVPGFEADEAKYLIGLLYRLSLRDCIHASQRHHHMGVIESSLGTMNRDDAYEEIGRYSYMAYYDQFVLPFLRSRQTRDLDTRRVAAECDLKQRSPGLRSNPKIRVLANRNDFLLKSEDLDWLEGTFSGGHCIVCPQGGHMGNLAEPEVQGRIAHFLLEHSKQE